MLVRAIHLPDFEAGDAIATLLGAQSRKFTYATIIDICLALPRAAISKISQAGVRKKNKSAGYRESSMACV